MSDQNQVPIEDMNSPIFPARPDVPDHIFTQIIAPMIGDDLVSDPKMFYVSKVWNRSIDFKFVTKLKIDFYGMCERLENPATSDELQKRLDQLNRLESLEIIKIPVKVPDSLEEEERRLRVKQKLIKERLPQGICKIKACGNPSSGEYCLLHRMRLNIKDQLTPIIDEYDQIQNEIRENSDLRIDWRNDVEAQYRYWSRKYYYVLHNIFLKNGKTLRYINMGVNPFAEDIAYLCPNLRFFNFGNHMDDRFLIDPFQLHVCHLLGEKGCVTPLHDLIVPGKFVLKILSKLSGLEDEGYFDSSIYGYLVQHPEEYGRYRHSDDYIFFPQVAEEKDPDTGIYQSVITPKAWEADDEKFETIILDDYGEGDANTEALYHTYTPFCREMYIPGPQYEAGGFPEWTHPFWASKIEDGFLDLFDARNLVIKRFSLEGVKVVV